MQSDASGQHKSLLAFCRYLFTPWIDRYCSIRLRLADGVTFAGKLWTSSRRLDRAKVPHSHRRILVPPFPPITFLLLGFNAIFGTLIGTLTARVPTFSAIGIPSFLWLVAGLFAFEMIAGLVLQTHPSALVTMPWRVAGLVTAFVCCYATLALLS